MTKKNVIQIVIESLSAIALICLGLAIGLKHKTIIVHYEFNEVQENNNEVWRYSFLNQELSNYIENLASELKIDPDLVVSILLVENPEFNPNAIHQNENGTNDLGYFQLNDKYIYQTFLPDYWDMDVDFNPFNPKMNTFLAMHHIKFLCDKLKVTKDVVAAYNCGVGAVMNNAIPDSTKLYVKKVMNNLYLLKAAEGEQNAD